MSQAAGNEQGFPRLDANLLTRFEFQIDPALQDVDELGLAHVVVPPGGLRHAGDGLGDLRPHGALGSLGDAEVAVIEEGTPARDARSRLVGDVDGPHLLLGCYGHAECLRCTLGEWRRKLSNASH